MLLNFIQYNQIPEFNIVLQSNKVSFTIQYRINAKFTFKVKKKMRFLNKNEYVIHKFIYDSQTEFYLFFVT